MDRVEAALARMRAREEGRIEEEQEGPKRVELKGYEWDAEKGRYFPRTKRKKEESHRLPECADLESRVIRSRGRLIRDKDVSVVPTCATMSSEMIAVGGGGCVEVFRADGSRTSASARSSSVTSIAVTNDGLVWGEVGEGAKGCLTTERFCLPIDVWSFAKDEASNLYAIGSRKSLKVYDAQRLVRTMKMSSDCLAVTTHQPRIFCSGSRDGRVCIGDSRTPTTRVRLLRHFPAAVDDVVAVDDFAILACDRNESFELVDLRKDGPLLKFLGRRASPATSSKVLLFADGYCCSGTRGHALRCWRMRDATPVADITLPSKASALIAVQKYHASVERSSLFQDDDTFFVTRELYRTQGEDADDHSWNSSLVKFSVKPRPMARDGVLACK